MEIWKSDVRWFKKKKKEKKNIQRRDKKKKEYPAKGTCATAGGGIRKDYLSMRLMLFNQSWTAWKVGNYNLWHALIAPSVVYSSLPIFSGKVYLRRDNKEMYWAPQCGIWIPTSLAVKLLCHLKYQEWGSVRITRGTGEVVGNRFHPAVLLPSLTRPLKNEICSLDKIRSTFLRAPSFKWI